MSCRPSCCGEWSFEKAKIAAWNGQEDHRKERTGMHDEVKAAAERLLNEDEIESILYGTSDRTVFEQDIQTVARATLEAGQEVARLRAALIGVAAIGEVVGEEDRCWCPDSFCSFTEHVPECWDARAALSTPGEPESSGGG